MNNKKWMLLCALIVLIVYFAGFFAGILFEGQRKNACQVTYSHKDKVIVMVGEWN